MKVRIETDTRLSGIVQGDEMKAGDYGLVVADESGNSIVGHYVYRHQTSGHIIDLSDVPMSWANPGLVRVQLLLPGESIKITRTE